MNQENTYQGSDNTTTISVQDRVEKKQSFVCPVDPAELSQCDSCQ